MILEASIAGRLIKRMRLKTHPGVLPETCFDPLRMHALHTSDRNGGQRAEVNEAAPMKDEREQHGAIDRDALA